MRAHHTSPSGTPLFGTPLFGTSPFGSPRHTWPFGRLLGALPHALWRTFESTAGPTGGRGFRAHRRRFHSGGPHAGGFGPWGAPWGGAGSWGGWGAWFGPHGFRRGPRARRGDIRAAILHLLAESDQPMHGYEMIRELRDRTGGIWRPSPGSIYPTLQLLEDEGLVTATERDGKKVYSLTDAGRAEVDARGGAAPWEDLTEPADSPWAELRAAGMSLMVTAMSAAQGANEAQLRRIAQTLRETRTRILRILGEEDED